MKIYLPSLPFFFLVVLGRDLDEREVREQGSDEKLSNMI